MNTMQHTRAQMHNYLDDWLSKSLKKIDGQTGASKFKNLLKQLHEKFIWYTDRLSDPEIQQNEVADIRNDLNELLGDVRGTLLPMDVLIFEPAFAYLSWQAAEYQLL